MRIRQKKKRVSFLICLATQGLHSPSATPKNHFKQVLGQIKQINVKPPNFSKTFLIRYEYFSAEAGYWAIRVLE